MATFSYNLTDIKIETGTRTRTRDITELYDCVAVTPCVDCSVCPLFVMPFISTDIFTYTLDFKIVLVEVLDLQGDVIQTQNSWGVNNLLTVNFSHIPLISCFRIRVNGECCFEFSYERISEDCEIDKTLLIWSDFDTKDCLGNNFVGGFTNKMRIYAYINHTGDTVETEQNDDRVTSEKIRETYLLEFNRGDRGLVPETYILQLFTKSTVRGHTIYLETNEKQYIFDKFTEGIEKGVDSTKIWFPKIKLQTFPCELDFICS